MGDPEDEPPFKHFSYFVDHYEEFSAFFKNPDDNPEPEPGDDDDEVPGAEDEEEPEAGPAKAPESVTKLGVKA